MGCGHIDDVELSDDEVEVVGEMRVLWLGSVGEVTCSSKLKDRR